MSTANWLELHSDLPDHPKVEFCAELLKIDPDMLVGKLCRLWSWALNNREDGHFLACEAGKIAEKMRWPKTGKKAVQQFIDALCAVAPKEKAGFLVKTEDGFEIYHWHEYAGKLLTKRANDRARRVRNYHGQSEDCSKIVRGQSADNPSKKDGQSADCPQDVAGITLNPSPLTSDDDAARTRAREGKAGKPPTPPSISPKLDEIGKLYEEATGSLLPSSLSTEIGFRLAEGTDADLLKEALRASIGKNNPGAYFARVMQNWTAQGIKTYRQLLDKVPKQTPSVKGGNGPPTVKDAEFDKLSRLSIERLMQRMQGGDENAGS